MRHRRLPEPFTFFVDECLGRHIVTRALGGALLDGEHIVTRPQGTMDEAWLPEAGERWICLTKDHALKRRPNELDAIRRVGAAIFMLGDTSGEEQARRILDALPVVRRVARTHDLALIARIQPDGNVLVLYEAGEQLATPKMVAVSGHPGPPRRPAFTHVGHPRHTRSPLAPLGSRLRPP